MVCPVTGMVNKRQALLLVPINLSAVTLVAPERVPAITPIEPVPAEVDFIVTALVPKLIVPVEATSSITFGLMVKVAVPPKVNEPCTLKLEVIVTLSWLITKD